MKHQLNIRISKTRQSLYQGNDFLSLCFYFHLQRPSITIIPKSLVVHHRVPSLEIEGTLLSPSNMPIKYFSIILPFVAIALAAAPVAAAGTVQLKVRNTESPRNISSP